MDDAMAHKMFGFIFCVFGAVGVLTSVMVSIFKPELGPGAPVIWLTGLMGVCAIAGGVGLYRQMSLARRAMIVEALIVLGAAVIGGLLDIGAQPMKAVILLTGIMPAVVAIAMLIQLERSAAGRHQH